MCVHVASGKPFCSRRCVCLCLPFLAVIFIVVLSIVILSSVPSLSSIEYHPSMTAWQNIIEIEFESGKSFWIAEANISVPGCDSSVIVVGGRPCDHLPRDNITSASPVRDQYYALTPVYFLEESVMYIFVEDNVRDENATIWILNMEDYLVSGKGIHINMMCDSSHDCSHANVSSCCYHANEYAGKTISHRILKRDFYFPVPKPPTHTFNVSYMALKYDIDATVLPVDTNIFHGTTKVISKWLDFSSVKCILLNSSCSADHHLYNVTVSNVSRRLDILFIPGVVFVVILLVMILLTLLLLKCTSLKSKWHHKRLTGPEPTPSTALIEPHSYKNVNINN